MRDDFDGDEQYKMLLIFDQELYKLSSKTGELKSVKMSPGKAAAQSGHATLGCLGFCTVLLIAPTVLTVYRVVRVIEEANAGAVSDGGANDRDADVQHMA